MDDLLAFRAELDEFMRWHPASPLSHEQLRHFRGLAYYDPNPDLAFVLPVERFPADEPLVLMETSTGETRPFRRWGRVRFAIAGREVALTVYSDPDGYALFLPFRDATNGSETYGAGRYLDSERPGLEVLPDGRLVLDFNYAYNPYCAYSDEYSCPLPPRENWLDVPIRAGEKAFAESKW
ncbi:MAG: DUF1684 domain-containing protein [Anaerolineae bacterium]|nr:DUF1684 domain-containing protein [Caldilineales bacterium]MCX7853064.1 DUF1684 domain-containing protein [Caldilineales bacterium]MDW8269323.1 DUF1684 domain-containing protein [Anaerolineae bacterium]